MSSDAKEVLIRAKNILCTKGWTQHQFERGDGACCMLGAVGNAAEDFMYPAEKDAEALLREVVPMGRIVSFNDAPCRTVDEVLAAFDKAIALADAQ